MALIVLPIVLGIYCLVHAGLVARLWATGWSLQAAFGPYLPASPTPELFERTAAVAYWSKSAFVLIMALVQLMGVSFPMAFALSFRALRS